MRVLEALLSKRVCVRVNSRPTTPLGYTGYFACFLVPRVSDCVPTISDYLRAEIGMMVLGNTGPPNTKKWKLSTHVMSWYEYAHALDTHESCKR